MYKLNTKSNSAKFFSWIWKKDVSDYNTMCPYFWNYVLTILFIVPILAIKFIAVFFSRTIPEKKLTQARNYVANSKVGDATENVVDFIIEKPKFWNVIGNTFKWLFITCLCIGGVVVALLIIGLFIFYTINCLAVVGAVTLLILAIYLIGDLNDKYNLRKKLWCPFKLFGNMVSSLYHNWCPLIKWG